MLERLLPVASRRLVTIGDDAALLEATKLLGGLPTDLVVVCNSDGLLVGVPPKRISFARSAIAKTAVAQGRFQP